MRYTVPAGGHPASRPRRRMPYIRKQAGSEPKPVTTDFRFSARVDYFATPTEAVTFALLKRADGFNVQGGATIKPPTAVPREPQADTHAAREYAKRYGGLYGVHWVDRKGEGWYG